MNLDKRVPVGTAVIIRRGEYVLLGKRKNAHGEGLWAPPGGKPEPGEDPFDAAVRETLEETGVVGDRWRALPGWSYDTTPEAGLHYVTLYFGCDARPNDHAENIEPHKCEGWKWLYHRALPGESEMFSRGIRPAIREVFGL